LKSAFISWLVSWKRPFFVGFLGYLGLRLWSTVVLLLLNFFPPTVIPSDVAVQNTLINLEKSCLFSRLFLAPWYRWDSVYYLELAQDGYSRPFLTVWPPLYSWLIRIVSLTGIEPMVSGIIVSNLCAILTLALLYRVSEEVSEGTGSSAVNFLVLFPTAFFLVAVYSESLYLVFTIASLWMAHQKRSMWAGLWAVLAVMTRLQGVILAVPLLYEGFVQYSKIQAGLDQKSRILSIVKSCLPALSPIITAGVYVAYIRFGIGMPWPWQTLASAWGQHTGWPWEGVIGNFTSLFGLRQLTTPINPLAQTMDLILVIFAIFCLGMVWYKKSPIPISYQLYAWIGLVVILTKLDNQGLLVSASRYVLSLFPVFIGVAFAGQKSKSKIINLILFSIGLATQAVLLVCFSWWIWVA